MTTARGHIDKAEVLLNAANPDQIDFVQTAGVFALLAIASTLADMADMDADTRTQPAVKPPAPPPDYQLSMPIDNHDGTYRYERSDGIPT